MAVVAQKDTLAGGGQPEGDTERCGTIITTIIHHFHTV